MTKLNIDMACLALKESEAEVLRLKTLLFQIYFEKGNEGNETSREETKGKKGKKKSTQRKSSPASKEAFA